MPADARKTRAGKIYSALRKRYSEVPMLFLDYGTDAQMLCSIILSAQSTDAQVNRVTEKLFRKYRTVRDFAGADRKTFEKEIRSTGYYRLKAKRVIDCFKTILKEHDGKVPLTMTALVDLPGVGRKTANLVLANKGIIEGIAVDTHVWRLAQRLGLSKRDDQHGIERDLMGAFDKKVWHEINGLLISHGRAVCTARSPKCSQCLLNAKGLCPRIGVSKSI